MGRTIWCAHLKDKRVHPLFPDKTAEKAAYCLAHQIVAIGWAGGGSGTDWDTFRKNAERYYAATPNKLSDFKRAANALEKMEKDDLVWVIAPDSDCRYLYRVTTGGDPKTDANQKDIDIGAYKQCEQVACYQKADLPDCLKKLSARRTLSRIRRPHICDEIEKLYGCTRIGSVEKGECDKDGEEK